MFSAEKWAIFLNIIRKCPIIFKNINIGSRKQLDFFKQAIHFVCVEKSAEFGGPFVNPI
jgi:hypothetical protein